MRSVLLVCAISLPFVSEAQSFLRKHIYLAPSITMGYTFGARVSYGADLDLGYSFTDEKGAVYRTGFSFSQYFVEAKHHTARISTASLMFQKDFTDVKVGVGRLCNRWGYESRNKSTAYGFSYDLSLRMPETFHNTWLGLRHFVFRPGDWPWFEIPYTSVYLKYKYNVIKPVTSDPESRAVRSLAN